MAPARGGDDQIHQDHDDVVAPAVSSVFPPKTGLPFEHFLLGRTQHDENEPDGCELREHPERHAQRTGAFGYAEKASKTLAHFNIFAALFGIGGVPPAAGEKNESDHEAQEEQRFIREVGEVRDSHRGII